MKALAKILFEISCTQDFQILLSKGHNSEKGRNSDMKKIRVNYFFMKNVHMKFKNPSIHHSKVNTHTDRQAESNMPFQLFQSWGHKKGHNSDMKKYGSPVFSRMWYDISKNGIIKISKFCNFCHYGKVLKS